MHGYQHKRMGFAASVGILSFVALSRQDLNLIIMALTIPFGSLLPDIDHDKTKLGRKRKKVVNIIKFLVTLALITFMVTSYLSGGLLLSITNGLFIGGLIIAINIVERNKHIKKMLGFFTMHRGIMHTLIVPAFLVGTTLWTNNFIYCNLIYGLSLGYLIHIIGDMATYEGAPICWPLKKLNVRYFKFKTDKNPKAIELVCNIWCLLFILFGIYRGLNGG